MSTPFEQIFVVYITEIIEKTFGFTPTVSMKVLAPSNIAIILDGTAPQRALMMGREAKTLNALKMLLRAFARQKDYFVLLFIAPFTFEDIETYYEPHLADTH